MTANDISSVMEQLGTFVQALQHENLNIIQMVLDHKKGLSAKENSQLVVTDPNFMMDVLKPETIKGVEETAKVMVSAGFEKDFSDVYNSCRRECLDKCLMDRLFRLQKLSIVEHLFKILKLFETLRDLIPEFESLFYDQYSVSLRSEAMTIWKRLGESIKGIFMELVSSFNGFDNFFFPFFYGLKIILL
ncbi:hypothetical protein P8452_43828 [Trifolium repens]|nr:hypothetical protein P8452_43828 [Trifolium repens]